jgi:uncharacterized protein YndB with AHSA1/START domain
MKVVARSENPMGPGDVRARTGKSWEAWYDLVDALDGQPSLGRRAITELLMKDHGLHPWWAQTIAVEYESARRVLEKDGRPKGYAICVTKTIGAPPERVFDAFATAAALDAWLGDGSSVAFTEGGRWSNADGNRGAYAKIARPKTLRFTWEDDDPALASTVEVKLAPKGDKCALVLNHERIQTRALADGLRDAWGPAVERLKRYVEG